MAVTLTRPVGTVIPDNTPTDKPYHRTLFNDVIGAINGLDPLLTPSYASRAAAEAGASGLAGAITQILVREGTALVVRSRTAFADDPLFPTGARWGVVLRQDASAIFSELRNGRVWFSVSAALSGVTPPVGTSLIVAGHGLSSAQIWTTSAAPNPIVETPTLIRDSRNQWWRQIWTSRDVEAAVATLREDMVRADADLSGALAKVTPETLTVSATDSPATRNVAAWTTAPARRNVIAAIVQGAPPQLGSPNAVLQTADVETLPTATGIKHIWRDTTGRIFERRIVGSTASDWAEMISPATRAADVAARQLGDTANAQAVGDLDARLTARLALLPPSQMMGRGDAASVVEMGGRPVMAVDADGRSRLVLDDWTVADLALRLSTGGGGGGGGSPVSPDILGPIDGWNVWQDGELATFTADLGRGSREYVKKANEPAWINGRSGVPVRLLYGDEMGNAGVSVAALSNVHNVATLNDGAGQAGLNGAVPASPVVGIQRAGAGFAALVADLWVSAQPVAQWALVRAESVAGASLTELATGQPISNLVRALVEAESILPEYKRNAIADAVSIMHGAGSDSPAYAADLLALMAAINSQVGPRRINLYQPSGTTERANFASAEGTLQAFRDKGVLPVTLVSPTYWCGIAAGTIGVLDAVAMTMLAELEARAALDAAWIAPLAFYAERIGAVVNIDFEVMPGVSMVAPTAGLFVDGAAISSIAIVADPVTGRMTRLRINLASVPSAPVTVRYCRGPSGRFSGDLRDSWSAPSVTGGTLYRRACSFQYEV